MNPQPLLNNSNNILNRTFESLAKFCVPTKCPSSNTIHPRFYLANLKSMVLSFDLEERPVTHDKVIVVNVNNVLVGTVGVSIVLVNR